MTSPVKITRRQMQIGPAVVHYDTAGSGAPLILLHGLSGSSRWWARNVDVLARHFRVYAVNFIGYGRSRRQTRFVLGQAAERLLAWMDQLHIARASVIGHSMGGRVAAALAADFPRRVERLVLVSAPICPVGRPCSGSRGVWCGLSHACPAACSRSCSAIRRAQGYAGRCK